jgi:hypothetical protein
MFARRQHSVAGMNVVSFLSPRPRDPHWSPHYDQCVAAQKISCTKFGLRQIVITDPGISFGAAVETFEVDLPAALMPALLAGQFAYLNSAAFDADTILTGVDCLIGKDPRAVFDGGSEDWDVAVTIGPFSDCPLNTGAIFCRHGTGPALAEIWRVALAGMGSRWGDDQRALAGELGSALDPVRTLRNGLRVGYLRCEEHNWAPEHERDRVEATVVHFRGARKEYIGRWCARFL